MDNENVSFVIYVGDHQGVTVSISMLPRIPALYQPNSTTPDKSRLVLSVIIQGMKSNDHKSSVESDEI